MSEETSVSEMERILLEDPHVKAIHHDEEWAPLEIDYNFWTEEWGEVQKGGIENLKRQLDYPYIEDDFGSSHNARRLWAKELEGKYQWFRQYHKTNALRINFIFAILGTLGNLTIGYAGPNKDELANLIQETKNKHTKGYNLLPTTEKIKHVKQLKQATYDILKFLSEQSQK